MKLKVAIVGCGKIADGHVGELQKMSDVDIVGVCDREVLMAEQLAMRFGIARFTDDFAELLASARPDVVHITTPPQSHVALARQAIDAGSHVYVEKPLALDHATATELVSHARTQGRRITVGHSFAFDPPALVMRKLIAEGVLGDPVHVESYFGYNLTGPFGATILGDPRHWVHALPGKLFHNNIDHMLNKITEFIVDERPEVSAHGWVQRPHLFGDTRDQMMDELRVVIRGKSVSGVGTFTSHVSPVSHFARVYGTRNIIHVDYNIRTVVVENGVRLPSAIGRLTPAFGRGWSYYKEGGRNIFRFARSRVQFFAGMNMLMRRFYASIRADADPPIATDDMLRMTALMDDIFTQLGQGGAR